MMNVYSTVSLDGNQIGTSHGSMLSVWTPEGVMAGKGEPVEAIAGTVQFMFVVFASEPERTGFKLRVYDAATDHIYAVTDEINFISEGAIGTLFEPFAFTAIDEVPQYTVSFDAGEHGTIVGGDSVVTVFENQDAPEPDIEADRPYIFAGWDVDVRNVVRNIYATEVYYKPTGAGTPQNPYRISNAEGLGVASRNPDAHYLLVRNIDLSHLLYREPPIAAQTPFTGSFNGAGRRITGLTIEGAYANGGLFGIIGEEGTVKNLAIEDCSVTGVLDCGALAGINFGSIRRCSSSGTVTDAYSAGGLVGYNYGTIFNSFSTAEVTGIITDTGGLIGVNEGVVSHCNSAKAVRGRGNSRLGGLIGRSERSERNAETTNSFWDVDTSGVSNSAGGKGLSKSGRSLTSCGARGRSRPTGRL